MTWPDSETMLDVGVRAVASELAEFRVLWAGRLRGVGAMWHLWQVEPEAMAV